MALSFFGTKENQVGLDISQRKVKAVEVESDGKPRLITYGGLEVDQKALKSGSDNETEIVKTVNEVLTRAKITSKKVVTALPSESVFNSIIVIPEVPDKELADAVLWEAKKYLPAPLEEVQTDWKIIKKDPANKKIEIFFAAAPKKLVQRQLSICEKAGLNVAALEIESLSLVRALAPQVPTPLVFVDIGYNSTNINIVENGIVRLTRNIASGGSAITKTIASNLNVSDERAEQFKKEYGFDSSKLEGQLLKTVKPIIDSIVNEVKRSIEFAQSQSKIDVRKVILIGGGAKIPELSSYFSSNLDREVTIGNPWQGIDYSQEIAGQLDEIGPSFAVACGLALRSS